MARGMRVVVMSVLARLTFVRDSYLIVGVTYVLGVDSSTQSTKALLVDAADGTVVEQRTAPHPAGTEVDPRAWLAAFDEAAGPLLGREIVLPEPGEYVARGAARQAAWALAGTPAPPEWALPTETTLPVVPPHHPTLSDPTVRECYAALRDRLADS